MEKKDLTEGELCLLLAEKLDLDEDEIPKGTENNIFAEAKKVDGLVEYLRISSGKDIRRYFAAQTDDERALIRGAFARTMYIMERIKSA